MVSFTVDQLKAIEAIADIDCDDHCKHCEAAYAICDDRVYFKRCFKGECIKLLDQLVKTGRI